MITKADKIQTQLIISTYEAKLYINNDYFLTLSKIETIIWTFIDGIRTINEIIYETGLEILIVKIKLEKFERLKIIKILND